MCREHLMNCDLSFADRVNNWPLRVWRLEDCSDIETAFPKGIVRDRFEADNFENLLQTSVSKCQSSDLLDAYLSHFVTSGQSKSDSSSDRCELHFGDWARHSFSVSGNDEVKSTWAVDWYCDFVLGLAIWAGSTVYVFWLFHGFKKRPVDVY